jgi:hypothetical protein
MLVPLVKDVLSLSSSYLRARLGIISMLPSNLTFGAGGKDKDGKHVVGWGYYEVPPVPILPTYITNRGA